VRTYISLPAGIAEMNFGTFIVFTLLGSLPWTFALAWVGMGLGNQIDKATQLSSVFHGLDVLVLVLLAAAIAYYIYRHIQRSRVAEEQARNSLDTSDIQRLRP
jgi:membrane protein DedA with SNARE-associated domain